MIILLLTCQQLPTVWAAPDRWQLSAVVHQLSPTVHQLPVPDLFAFSFRRTKPRHLNAAERSALKQAQRAALRMPAAQLIPTGDGRGELPINGYDMASDLLMGGLDPIRMPPSEWGGVVSTAIAGHLPHGVAVTPSKERATRDPDNLWLLGKHKHTTEEQRSQVQALLKTQKERKMFAYSLNDFEGGYTGPPAYFQPLDPCRRK